jgi:hypothetical protein
MPEYFNSNEDIKKEENLATPTNIERKQELIQYLTKNKGVFALLSKNTKMSISFSDDPDITGYMDPQNKAIVLGTHWMAQSGLDNVQALFVPVHEFGHADNMMEEGDKYIQSFDVLRQYTTPIKSWFNTKIQEKGKTLTENQKNNLSNYIDKKYFRFWNVIDDIAINRWSQNKVPLINRNNSVENLYKDHLFPFTNKLDQSADYSDKPLIDQYENYLLRNAMVPDSMSKTIISTEVLDLINEKNHQTLFTDSAISIKDIISYSTNKILTTNAEGKKIQRILSYSNRFDITMAFITPTYDMLLKKDFENLLDSFENEEEEGKSGQGSNSQPGPKSMEEFLDSLENQTSSNDITIFDNEDINGNALPSAFKPENPEDLEKIKEKIQEILEKIKQDNKAQTIEEKNTTEFLNTNPEVNPSDYENYQKTKESVAVYSKELAEFWGELLGKQLEKQKINTHLAENGSKTNMNALIRNYGRLQQGNTNLKIFDKTVRGYQEGNEKAKEVRFRIVLDRSGSMAEGKKLLVLKQMYTVLMESFQNYKVRAKLSGALKTNEYIDFRTECWGYGSTVEKTKPLSAPMIQDEQAAVIKSYTTIKANLIDNYDEKMVASLDEQIKLDKSTKSSKQVLDVVFYFTDGSPSNTPALQKALESVDSKSVLWRAFQIEADSAEFDTLWNGQPNMRGRAVTLETMIPTVVEQLKEIIGNL